MGEALTVLIERVGLVVPDEGDAAARGREAATTLASGSWSSFIEAFEPATTKALRGYQCDS